MANKIIKLKDKSGSNYLYPQTIPSAIATGDNRTLDQDIANLSDIEDAIGSYIDQEDKTITIATANKAISSSGELIDKSGYSISAPISVVSGELLRIKAGTTADGVCNVAEKVTSPQQRLIDYVYTYNADGTIATASASYNGETHAYTYAYDSEGRATITETGVGVVASLPLYFQATVNSYIPMTVLPANATIPANGYILFIAEEAMSIVVTVHAETYASTIIVKRTGLTGQLSTKIRSLKTKLLDISNQFTESVSKLEELYGRQVEGYIRVSGISDPAFTYKHYRSNQSVFDCLKPVLVQVGTGKPLHVLNPVDWSKDIHGNTRALDGTEGELLICNTKPIYHITGKVTYSCVTYDVFLRSLSPFSWNGRAADLLEPFGWSPDYVTRHTDTDNVTRLHSVRNTSWPGEFTASSVITGKFVPTETEGVITEEYDDDGTFFDDNTATMVSTFPLYTGEQYAMNLNSDTTKTVPFMNQTAAGAELIFGHLLAECGTFDAHKASMFGQPFCSGVPATSETYWSESNSNASNGFRYKKSDDTWGYYSFEQKINFGTGANHIATLMNSWRTPWKMFEPQRVLAYAKENNVPELTWFVFENNIYKYRSVPGLDGLAQGVMTAVLWKKYSSKMSAGSVEPDTEISIAGNRCEFLVSTAIYRGIKLDVSPGYWTSGLVFTEDENGQYKAYMQRDQSLLAITPSGTKPIAESWTFESAYKHVGTFEKGTGYRKDFSNDCIMLPNTNANKNGAGIHTYVCAYNIFNGDKATHANKLVRGFLRGLYANYSALSPLYVYAYYAPSASASCCAFGICCRLSQTPNDD